MVGFVIVLTCVDGSPDGVGYRAQLTLGQWKRRLHRI
jgi:hypothetical protein